MASDQQLPAIRFALPLNSESRWSDMLAVLIETDPEPICRLLELSTRPIELRVERESAVNSANRPDLLLWAGDRRVAVVEVKVLAGLGPDQLDRYWTAEPDAESHVIVFPERLVVDTTHSPKWTPVTWEALLDAYGTSRHSWVQTCARAWRGHIRRSVPKVDSATVWNDLTDGEGFVVALRARMSWVFSALKPPAPIAHDLVPSSAGVSWVARMFADARAPGYQVMVEVEERLGVRDFPKVANAARRPKGPSAKVVLLQHGVTTSAGFDWDYLLAMWEVMRESRTDWVTNRPNLRAAHDKAGYRAMLDKGGPRFLGIGFGEAQARKHHICMFGARIQFAPDITLGKLTADLQDLGQLVLDLAIVEPPNAARSDIGSADA